MSTRRKNLSFVFGAAATEQTQVLTDMPVGDEIVEIKLVVPNFTNVVTATLRILDNGGTDADSKYTSAALAKNATYFLQVSRFLNGNTTMKITLSGVPGGAGGTVTGYMIVR